MDEYIRLSNVKVDPEQPDMAALDKFHFYLLHQEMVFLLGGVWSGMAVIKAILTGKIKITSGNLFVEGRPVKPDSLEQEAVVCIDANAGFCRALSVEENVRSILGRTGQTRRAFQTQLSRQMQELGLERNVCFPAGKLSSVETCLLWLVVAQMRGASLVILDGTENVYSLQEWDRLRPALRQVRQGGCSVLVLGRQLNPLLEDSDRVLLLRHGKIQKIFYRGTMESEQIMSILKELESVPQGERGSWKPADGVAGGTLPVHAGDILGVWEQDGRVEEPRDQYLMKLFAQNGWEWPEAFGKGRPVYIAENSGEQLAEALSVGGNIALVASRKVKPRGGILPEKMKQFYQREFQNRFHIEKADSLGDLRLYEKKLLSLYRWGLTRPPVLFLENPLLRIPLAERQVITSYFQELAAEGICLVIFAGAWEDLSNVCTYVLLVQNKRVVQVLKREIESP